MQGPPVPPAVSIRPWAEGDLPLLRRMNTEELWAHLGGPETSAAVQARHKRFLEVAPGKTRMFAIMFGGQPAGNVGYWQRRWQDRDIYEVGWMVLPEFQGHGIATSATSTILQVLRAEAPHAVVHAFPSIDHPASNAVCRKVGFSLIGETDFEFPAGRWMRCNDWHLAW
jgi:RimJ/RimL family protein N-acetyltransferase